MLAFALPSASGAEERRVHLGSNEGQRPDQAVDVVHLVTNHRAPQAPADEPPRDEVGREWHAPGFRPDATWRPALPVWRSEAWPDATLPRDEGGALVADWIWSSPLPPELLGAVFFPDADNGSRFARRYSDVHDSAGTFANGYIPAAQDSAAYVRRDFCLPANLAVADGSLTVLADSQARVFFDGALAHDTCDGEPSTCADAGVRSFERPSIIAPALTGGAHALALQVWSWQERAVLSGVLWHLRIAYEPTEANATLASAVLDEAEIEATVRSTALDGIPAGLALEARSWKSTQVVRLGAIAPAGQETVRFPAGSFGPGALVTLRVDPSDCLGRAAGGELNLLGGSVSGEGVLAAIGELEETSETDNVARLRLAPAFDAAWNDVAVASPSVLVRGASEAGTRVRVRRAGLFVAEAEANADGTFEVRLPLALGENGFTATASGDGVESDASTPIRITYDPNAPPAPIVDTPSHEEVLETLHVDVRGRGVSGATVRVSIDGEERCSVTVGGSGDWACALELAGEGRYALSAHQRSRAGLSSERTELPFSVAFPRPDAGEPDAGSSEDGGVVDEPDAGDETPDAGTTTPSRRYATGGGGGCAQADGSLAAIAIFAVLLLARRRRALFVVAILAATSARAQSSAAHEGALFTGPTPLTSAAAPRSHGLAATLSFDYARDPLVLLDAKTRQRAATLVSDRLDARAAISLPIHERLELALAMPATPLHRGAGPLEGLPGARPGIGDLSAALLLGLVTTDSLQLGLSMLGTAPSAGAPWLGAGTPTIRGALVVNGRAGGLVAWGAELGARTAAEPVESTSVIAVERSASLEVRAGLALLLARGRIAPFAELAASSPTTSRFARAESTPAIAQGGVRFALPSGAELSIAGGRGLTDAPGSPAARGTLTIGWAPGAAGRPVRVPGSGLVPPPLRAPSILVPVEGDVLASLHVTIEGAAEPGAVVTLLLDGRRLTTVTAGADGLFRYEPPEALTAGMHELVASQSTERGVSEPSAPRGFLLEPLHLAVDDERRARRIEEILRLVNDTTHLSARETPEGVAVATNVLFDFDSAIVKEQEEWKLRELARIILSFPAVQVRIDSHTDDIGSGEYNLQLSQRRAQSVIAHLTDYEGVSEVQVKGVGFGATRPVASNKTAEGRAKNRRFAEAVFVVP